jgi:DNA polymerase-1
VLSVDIETYDPHLHELGDGVFRHDGWIAHIGLYDGETYVGVQNIGRAYGNKDEWDNSKVYEWLASDEPKVFHNGVYDMPWLLYGPTPFTVNGVINDTMTRAGLIDEYADLDLDSCCKRFKIKGKNYVDTIEKWYESVRKVFGYKANRFWQNLDQLWNIKEVREQVAKYNKQDCVATYNLYYAEEKQMAQLQEAYQTECDLYPVIMIMKKNGAIIDTVARDRLTQQIRSLYDNNLHELEQYGLSDTIIRSPKKMALAMHQLGIHSELRTATGAESWSADALDLIDHPAVSLIQSTKNLNGILTKFLDASLVKSLCSDGRIHCTFSPNKRDDGGTITGRFASSKPNLQNIPAREEKHGQNSYGDEIRSLFVPEEGCMLMACDYHQCEFVFMANFAKGPQAAWLKDQIRQHISFHEVCQHMMGLPSKTPAKTINLGIMYGMGKDKMYSANRKLWNELGAKQEPPMNGKDYAYAMRDLYVQKLPVVKDTMRWVENVVRQQGYITSIGGRIHHKPKPMYINGKWNDQLYKMTNYWDQGSCSDILKHALITANKEGLYDIIKLHLTVHDENVASVPYNKIGAEAAFEFQQCMDSSYANRLEIPMWSENGIGPNWGYKHSEEICEEMKKGIFNRSLKTGEVNGSK